MSLASLKLPILPNERSSLQVLPASIVHWKLVESLFEKGKMEHACKTLTKWAATHRGATQEIQYDLDGAELTTFTANEARISYREWYWRKAFELFFLSVFKGILRVKELPPAPLIGASWETEFKKLCKELNGTHPADVLRVKRFQSVPWTQRELDEMYALCESTSARPYPSLASVLEHAGAQTTPNIIDSFWAAKDRELTQLIGQRQNAAIVGEDLSGAVYQQIIARINELSAEGAVELIGESSEDEEDGVENNDGYGHFIDESESEAEAEAEAESEAEADDS